MAEIKSTLERVMERLDNIGKASTDEIYAEEKIREGMRIAASFLRAEVKDLHQSLAEAPNAEQIRLRQGMLKVLLRNIILPKNDEQHQSSALAMQGLMSIGGSDLAGIFSEIKNVLARYREHRNQLKEQLETSFAEQMKYMEANLAQQTGMALKLDPAQHPKFQEEWQRLNNELNEQYGKALKQYKSLVEQRLSP